MIELVALANGVVMGVVRQGRDGRVTFTYEDAWRTARDGYPLSLSMPLVVREHPHDVIHPFLAGLLPDNDRVLEHWGRRFAHNRKSRCTWTRIGGAFRRGEHRRRTS